MLRLFRKWLKPNRPTALTQQEWRTWNKNYRENYPVRYKISKVLSRISGFAYRMKMRYWDVKDFITQRNVKVRTGLKPGYADTCDLMLNTMMTMLVDYVEIDCAWSNLVARTFRDDKKAMRTYRLHRYLPIQYRNAADGLAHLAWETTLDNPSLDKYEASPEQARVAREVLAIYNWWKNDYPKYDDIWNFAPKSSLNFDSSINLYFEESNDPSTEEAYAKHRENMSEFYDVVNDIEAQQKATIEEMTIRLMKIRPSLWK